MEKLGKDLIGIIFDKMSPVDWYCTSLVTKKWWIVIKKWLAVRKELFLKFLRSEIDLFAIDIKNEKDKFCIRPMYHLQSTGTGCKGKISNYVCFRHKLLSSNSEICEICLERGKSPQCFGNRCSSLKCRDYMYILKNGNVEKVKGYRCSNSINSTNSIYNNVCTGFTDARGGLCFKCGLSTTEYEEIKPKTYVCESFTKTKNKCTLNTSSRIKKCHHHVFSVISLI